MKKSILKNVAILSLALFGLGIIGNNVFADPPPKPPKEIEEAGPDGGGGHSATYTCTDAESWRTERTFWYRYRQRICAAPRCDRNYHKDIAPSQGSCTVHY